MPILNAIRVNRLEDEPDGLQSFRLLPVTRVGGVLAVKMLGFRAKAEGVIAGVELSSTLQSIEFSLNDIVGVSRILVPLIADCGTQVRYPLTIQIRYAGSR